MYSPKKGMKVVCKGNGQILTISDVQVDSDGFTGLLFEEIKHSPDAFGFSMENFKPIYKSMELLYAIAKTPPKRRIRGRNPWDSREEKALEKPLMYFIGGRWKTSIV